ncbi:MAG: toprim domain-containing protein [Oscillospiraceae bacterium]|nr:toprim domain-containing protein [Oscillospiraceae bacterium]
MPKKSDIKTYTDLDVLEGAARVRKRPGVMFGSASLEGCQHAVFEIISNAIDEARNGHGDCVEVSRFLDGSIQVRDFGRGIPMDWNEKQGRYNWELAFCELYAGGKYNPDAGGGYEYALGLNGLGLCATQYASEYMEAEVWREGTRYTLRFEHGEPVSELEKNPCPKTKKGTRIKWKADLKVFTEIDVPIEYFRETLRRQAIVNSGIRFVLRDEKPDRQFSQEEILYQNGISDYILELAEDTQFTTPITWHMPERKGRDRADKLEYKCKMSVALCFSNKRSAKEYYHNSSFLENGGSPEMAARSAFVGQIDAYLKQTGKYTKSDGKITWQDICDCLILVISSFSTHTDYENQTKKAFRNKFVQDSMQEFLRHNLEVYFLENKIEADKIAEQSLINMRSRVRAENTRQSMKKTLSQGLDMANRVQKFVDCRSKDTARREIFIVEGDSALGACKQARDSEYQAIIPVRGKILNCLKSDYAKIFKNDIITDLIKVLGCGVAVTSKNNRDLSSFSLENLRWSKVIICTDADVDGFQIRTLILTMLYRLTPDLIENGKVYIAESPLYEISCGKETWFAYTEREKNEVLAELEGKRGVTMQRSKGLGENDAEMMNLTTMNPATRRLIQIEPAMTEKTSQMFDLLLGDNLAGRKDFIAQRGHEFMEFADVS